MKQNNDNQIKDARANKTHKALNPETVSSEANQDPMVVRIKRRRRSSHYAKKIMNDPFIMTV